MLPTSTFPPIGEEERVLRLSSLYPAGGSSSPVPGSVAGLRACQGFSLGAWGAGQSAEDGGGYQKTLAGFKASRAGYFPVFWAWAGLPIPCCLSELFEDLLRFCEFAENASFLRSRIPVRIVRGCIDHT